MHIMQSITDYILKSILTTHGDLVVRGASIPERLAAVAVGQVFKSGGVGASPAWGVPSIGNMNMKIVTGFRDTAGAEVITGVGFQPSAFIFFGYDEEPTRYGRSFGFDLITSRMVMVTNSDTGYDNYTNTHSVYSYDDGSNYIAGVVSAVGADGFTITWTETGTAGCRYVCLAIG